MGGGGEQSGIGAKVFLGHCVGTAIARIGFDRLAVAEVDDDQKDDDRAADGKNVMHARQAERKKTRPE